MGSEKRKPHLRSQQWFGKIDRYGVALLMGCGKTTPAWLMGAAS
jgi:dihydroxyacid dehydratase/phosphogluconate dehydratase